MNLLGLLIGFAGVIEIYNSRSFLYKKGFLAYLLFLLGTILASYAKFSSGVFLLVMLVGLQSYIFIKHRRSNNYSLHFANFIFVSAVMILVYIVDLSGRIKESRFIAVTLSPDFYSATSALNAFVEGLIQTPRMALSYMGIPAWLFISGTLLLLALAILNNYTKLKFNPLSLFDLDLILVAYVLIPIVLGFHFNMWNGHDPNSENQYLGIWLLWFCSFVAVVVKLISVSRTKHLLRIVILNSFVSLSLVYAFGAGDGIVLKQTGSVGVYLLVAFLNALVLSGSRSGFASIIATGVVISIGMVSVYQSNEFPYRRLPTYQQNVAYEIGLSKTTIYMDPHTVKSLNSVKSDILQGGWSQENPIIDATGHNPGLIFALGATTIRTLIPTWSNLPGTARVFEYSLENLSTSEKLKDPEKYWFMIEDSGLLGTTWNTSSSLVAFIESKLKIKIDLVGKFGSIGIYKPINP
jgi:hypothetical protein